jgi:histidinol-phosphate phosphatase family protein
MPARPTQAVILAGGRGTRLQPLTDDRPKAMVEFHGKPFLEYMIEMLRKNGFERVLLLLGYLPDVIIEHFGDGSRFGVSIEYDVLTADDLTAYRVEHAKDRIDDTFLLCYCDNYWPMLMDEMWETYLASGKPAQITVYANDDEYTSHSVIVEADGSVSVFDRSRTTPGLAGVEISYAILDKHTVLTLLPTHQELFEVAVYEPLARRGELGAFWTWHRYYSVGGHRRLPLTEAFFAGRPAVIIDRDGVLNERPPRGEYVVAPEGFRWLPGSLEAIRLLSEANYQILVVSNQAGVARGALTMDDLSTIHDTMQADIEAAGGHIDAIYVCPHHWDEGCRCRKPAPGMLVDAQRDFHLDLTRTHFFGDDERDGEAADAAGSLFELVTDERDLLYWTHKLLANELREHR